MGSWGLGVFDCDASLDFLRKVGKRPTKRAILDALALARDPERAELMLSGPASQVLCAAEERWSIAQETGPDRRFRRGTVHCTVSTENVEMGSYPKRVTTALKRRG
jgi:hypothetical protein